MVTASGYDVSYYCNQKIPGSNPGGEETFFCNLIEDPNILGSVNSLSTIAAAFSYLISGH